MSLPAMNLPALNLGALNVGAMNRGAMNQPRVYYGVLGTLALVLALEWLWPASAPSLLPPPKPRLINHAEGPKLAERDTAAWGDTVLARPIFSVSRRPAKIVHSTGAVTAVGQARLSGILITSQGRRAIFAPEGGGHPMVLSEGAALNATTIRSIQPHSVTLASGAVLRPSFDRNRSLITTAPFQPIIQPGFPNPGMTNPGFPNPNFQNPNFPNPAFPNPAFPNPGFQNPGIPPQPQSDDATAQVPPVQPFVRPTIPQRREP